MGFLSPLLLLLAGAAAVPLVLHLLRRQRDRRISFPALRYLRRTTREHAREIRFRQLLLLALRVAAVIIIAIGAARLFLPLPGGDHEPTAMVLVLDNSLSSGVVEGELRRLDEMKEVARRILHRATSQDRIWILKAGSPGPSPLPSRPRPPSPIWKRFR